MFLLYNCITLCKYYITKPAYTIEFEYKKEDDVDDDEIDCNCNLCFTFRNILFFATKRLCRKQKQN